MSIGNVGANYKPYAKKDSYNFSSNYKLEYDVRTCSKQLYKLFGDYLCQGWPVQKQYGYILFIFKRFILEYKNV